MTSVLNTLGVGSGIDTTLLIDTLVKAERDPRDTVLTTRSTRVEARISGLAQVKSGLSALTAALVARTRGGALGPLPGSSDSSIIAASATNGATPLLSPVELEVKALAGGQTLVSATLGSGAPVGQGMLTFRLGTATANDNGFSFAGGASPPIEVTIDAGNDSLTGLRDAINAAQAGHAGAVQASIITDGTGARLVLKGVAGAASAFIVTADPVAGDVGLARFVHQPATSAMTVAASARDASIGVDGVTLTRPTNNFSDLIDGVTLDLRRAAPGAIVTVAATRDADGLKTAARDLVAAINELNTLTAGLVKAGSDGSDAGALAGDSTMRRLRGQLSSLTSTSVAGTSGITRLADLGITTARDGSLTIDDARLAAAVAANPDGAEKLLAGLTGGTTAPGPLSAISTTLAGTGSADTSYTREQTAIVRDKADLDARMTTYRATLVKQYAAMESAVAASKSIQSFLEAQIKAWNQTTN